LHFQNKTAYFANKKVTTSSVGAPPMLAVLETAALALFGNCRAAVVLLVLFRI
jgi:hypothetical protein